MVDNVAKSQEKMTDVRLSFNFQHLNEVPVSPAAPGILIIFINGLMLPQAMWTATINLLKTSLIDNTTPVSCVTYDRYGQGQSRPSDQPDWKPVPHDLLYSAQELTGISYRVIAEHWPGKSRPKVLFVSHSIGVPLARLYCDRHPGVSAHLFLDSNIANTDFVSIFPDPDAPDFNRADLPQDSTVDDLRGLRDRMKMMFHPTTPNPEGLDRLNLSQLLPHAEKPKLTGPDGKAPYLTVVGHDPEAFAAEGFKLQGTPKGLNFKYFQPFWEKYNQGLMELSEPSKTKGVVIAKGAGHFVQRDNPQCVADEITELVEKLAKE